MHNTYGICNKICSCLLERQNRGQVLILHCTTNLVQITSTTYGSLCNAKGHSYFNWDRLMNKKIAQTLSSRANWSNWGYAQCLCKKMVTQQFWDGHQVCMNRLYNSQSLELPSGLRQRSSSGTPFTVEDDLPCVGICWKGKVVVTDEDKHSFVSGQPQDTENFSHLSVGLYRGSFSSYSTFLLTSITLKAKLVQLC